MAGPWTRAEASASGQVFEFRLWAALAEQSRGGLHAFLPLADRGLDALVHRLSDGEYLRVQAKARSSLVDGEVHLVVWAVALMDDDALLVSGLVIEGGLGPTMLVAPVSEFKRLADSTSADGNAVYSMGFGMRPRSDSRWLPFLVASERLAERFGVTAGAEAVAIEPLPIAQPPSWRSDIGFIGESEVVRLLAREEGLNLFRPFPDLETCELAVLHLASRCVLGLQVKTMGIESFEVAAEVSVLAASFRPSQSTYFVVLAWRRDVRNFHEECLVIPSEEVRGICEPGESAGHLKFYWHPGSRKQPRLDAYRRPLDRLGGVIRELASGGNTSSVGAR